MVVPTGTRQRRRGRAAGLARRRPSGDVLRPPVALTPGWQAIIGWLLGIVGFGAAWVAVVVKPAVARAAAPAAGGGHRRHQRSHGSTRWPAGSSCSCCSPSGSACCPAPSSRRRTRSDLPGSATRCAGRCGPLPLLAVVTGGAVPAGPDRHPVPPAGDRPRRSSRRSRRPCRWPRCRTGCSSPSSRQLSGPWRIGSLDVYDGKDWRLPPFAENRLADVPARRHRRPST